MCPRFPLYASRGTLLVLIAAYCNKETEQVANGFRVKKFEAIAQVAARKLSLLRAATSLEVLTAVPGNRLEVLKGDRKGQHSIRINDQYRSCFTWKEGAAYDVEIVDYH